MEGNLTIQKPIKEENRLRTQILACSWSTKVIMKKDLTKNKSG